MGNIDTTIETLKSEIATRTTTLKANRAWSEVERLFLALGIVEELAHRPKTPLEELFGFTSGVVGVGAVDDESGSSAGDVGEE
jgi:hypothetical protein